MNFLINCQIFLSYFLYSESATAMENIDTKILFILFLNILSYLYITIKFYKVLCYARLTCDWFPMLNPYNWPFSFLQTITNPYFRFWSKVLPSLKFKKSSVEISGIIALEALNAVLYFCVRSVNVLLVTLDNMDKALPL